MPDITMCVNSECALRGRCYRYRAVATPIRQSFARFDPISSDDCNEFLPIQDGSRLRPTDDADQLAARATAFIASEQLHEVDG